eukprot:2296894-Prymnesium_polylepis.1
MNAPLGSDAICGVRGARRLSDSVRLRCGCALTLHHSLVCERQQGPSVSQTRSVTVCVKRGVPW